jgi:phage tail sheath protein FI
MKAVTDGALTLELFTGVLDAEGVLIDTVKVSNADDSVVYEAGTHYTLAFNADGHVVVNAKKNVGGGIEANDTLKLSYTVLDPDAVDIYDVIGGYNALTGKNEGLELVDEIYPRFRLIPGQLLAPGFSSDPAVAAVMETKAGNINGHFRCIALNDIPTVVEDEDNPGQFMQHRYTDVPAWKNENNLVSTRQINGYPKVRLGEQIFHFSTQLAGLICQTDAGNGGIPYNSPSNKNMKINGLCYADGEEVVLGNMQANYLNGNGIITGLNFTNGWTAWGNRTGAYPGNTDVKDAFIPVRRMFDWIGNTIVLTYWNKIDFPLTRRVINTVIDSINIWLNGLKARQFILGGRVEFLESDNPNTDLIDGIAKFRVSIAPPPPYKEGHFILQYDPEYLRTLFATE